MTLLFDLVQQPATKPTADLTAAERMQKHTASYCSTVEILELITGSHEAAAAAWTACLGNIGQLAKMSLAELSKLPGMSTRKAAALVAALELGRRRTTERALEKKVVTSSADVAEYLRTIMQDLHHEEFHVIFLNRANKVQASEKISSGGITGTVVDPRMILKRALELNAVALILAHNHPSGSIKPSRADEELTRKINEAAKYFDIKVLDHVIVSDSGYYSFADEGLLY